MGWGRRVSSLCPERGEGGGGGREGGRERGREGGGREGGGEEKKSQTALQYAPKISYF